MEKVTDWFEPKPYIPRKKAAASIPAPKTPEQVERRRAKARLAGRLSRQQPFVPLGTNFDPLPGWQVTYGTLHSIGRRLLPYIDNTIDRRRFHEGRYVELPWGRVRFKGIKTQLSGRAVSGGSLWYTGGQIFDVRPFFMQSFEKTAALYGTDNLPAIMEQARRELIEIGLFATQNNWYRTASIADYVLRLPEFKNLNIPDISVPREPPAISEQCIGHVANGFIPGPIYEYDLVSAFASGLLEVPELRPYVELLHDYRVRLADKPTARIIKIAQSVLPGKLISDRVNPRWQNRSLGLYTRAVTRSKLTKAMMQSIEKGGTIFRWYIDGFYTDVRIEPDDGLTGQLGSWKETVHEGGMLIADLSIFRLYDKAGNVTKERVNGYTDLDWDAIRDDPQCIRVTRVAVDWQDTLAEKRTQLKLLFENGYHNCDYCPTSKGYHLTREGWDQYFS
jgi:hypothetical protein